MKKVHSISLILASCLLFYSCESDLSQKVNQQEQEIQRLENRLNSIEQSLNSDTPPTKKATPKFDCKFDNSKYVQKSEKRNYLRLYNLSGNQIDISGRAMSGVISFGVKAQIVGNKFIVVSGNATGELSLLEDCKTLVGSLKSKDTGRVTSFDLIKI